MSLTAEPGTLFQYGPAPFQVFGEVMKRKLAAAGQDPDPLAYLHRRILDPIGLVPTDWRRTAAGDPLMPQGAVLTAREWAKFGEFVRLGGAWGGRQLVDPQAFRELFVGSAAHPGYGISWWLPHPAKVPDVVTASTDMGNVSQHVPSLHPFVGVTGVDAPLHTADFAEQSAGEEGFRLLDDAAAAMAHVVRRVATDPALRAQVRERAAALAAEGTQVPAER